MTTGAAWDRISDMDVHQETMASAPPTNVTAARQRKRTKTDESQSPPPTRTVPLDPALVCRYPNKVCLEPRVPKKHGELHSYCAFHRQKAQEYQRKLEQKKREQRKRVDSGNQTPPSGAPTPTTSPPPASAPSSVSTIEPQAPAFPAVSFAQTSLAAPSAQSSPPTAVSYPTVATTVTTTAVVATPTLALGPPHHPTMPQFHHYGHPQPPHHHQHHHLHHHHHLQQQQQAPVPMATPQGAPVLEPYQHPVSLQDGDIELLQDLLDDRVKHALASSSSRMTTTAMPIPVPTSYMAAMTMPPPSHHRVPSQPMPPTPSAGEDQSGDESRAVVGMQGFAFRYEYR